MEYSIYITLDKEIKKDYCILTSNSYDENMINLNIYTNGLNKIDFKNINYISFDPRYCSDFISYFSYGRSIINNSKMIYLTNTSEKEKNTKKDNRELMRIIEENKLQNKKIYVDVGSIKLSEEDIDSIKPLKKCKNAFVTFDDTSIYHSVEELEIIYDMVNEIVKKTNKHKFSQLEKMLYSFDLIKTNFITNPEYEKKMEKILSFYNEPSFCYSLIYKEVLDRLSIKNSYAFGDFFLDDTRAINIAYVNDEEYNLEGVYYFDIGNNSKQKVMNSLLEDPTKENIQDKLVNNYKYFCKTKAIMQIKGCLDTDYAFGDFDDEFMQIYDAFLDKEGLNGVYKLRGLINNVSNFIDGKPLIDSFKGIKDEYELDDIRENTERFVELFSNEIEGEDFLELLFNVRKVEYIENKELFPLSVESLKQSLFNSQFPFSKMMLDFSYEEEYEQEDIEELIQETFESSFEESINREHIEERIRSLKLSLNKDINKPKKDDNN